MLRFNYLHRVIRKNKWTRGVELGVFRGETLFHILRHNPELSMIGVDPFKVLPSGAEYYDHVDHTGNEQVVDKEAVKYRGRVELLKMTTNEAVSHVEDESVDFVFIDADHRTEAVRQDIKNWWPKVRHKGWLMGHDYNWSSVRVAVDEAFGDSVQLGLDNVWYTPKT